MEYSYYNLHLNMDLRQVMDYFDSHHIICINHINKQCSEKSVLNLLYLLICICCIVDHLGKIQVSLLFSSKDDLQYIYFKKILFLTANQSNNLHKDHTCKKYNGTRIINRINWLSYIDHNMVDLGNLVFCLVASQVYAMLCI